MICPVKNVGKDKSMRRTGGGAFLSKDGLSESITPFLLGMITRLGQMSIL